MRDCPNVAMREQLPELLHGLLAGEARLAVERHVAGCAECAAELSLLRDVRASIRSPKIDVARIASAVPPYAVSHGRSVGSRPWLRVAAAAALVAGAAGLWSLARRDAGDVRTPPVAQRIADSGAPVATAQVRAQAVTSVTQLSLGEPLSDLSDGELRALEQSVADLDAVPSAEVESLEPSLIDIEGDS